MKYLVQLWKADNDSNGNPRRLYVFMNPKTGQIIKAIDDGYKGRPYKYDSVVELPAVNITATEYRVILKEWGVK